MKKQINLSMVLSGKLYSFKPPNLKINLLSKVQTFAYATASLNDLIFCHTLVSMPNLSQVLVGILS